MTGIRRAHHQVVFAVLAVGVGAYALLQGVVTPVHEFPQVHFTRALEEGRDEYARRVLAGLGVALD